MKTALLIVERDFLDHHVGVRRVIVHYWRQLEQQGFRVTLGAPFNGRLRVGRGLGVDDVARLSDRARSDAPDWVSGQSGLRAGGIDLGVLLPGRTLKWSAEIAHIDDFDISIVTNPWLCAAGLPPGRITAGIVYDMVPNLLACGVLNLGQPMDIYEFARDHDTGYRLYLERAAQILCISESSRADFIRFYRLGVDDCARVRTLIPFEPAEGLRIKSRPRAVAERPRVLLVNVLDPRKNFDGARAALKLASQHMAFDVDVVGRERMPLEPVMTFLRDLSDLGYGVSWYRNASDLCLQRLYADADLLLFPSFYEGLGLPVLEAQNQGVPVVTSNTSSCVEVNMNADLCVDPLDHPRLASRVLGVLDGSTPHLSGPALRSRLVGYLNEKNVFDANAAAGRNAVAGLAGGIPAH